MRKKLSVILEECRVKVQNAATDEEIKAGLAPFGYDEPKLKTGTDLYDETIFRFQQQVKEKQDWETVNDHYQESKEKAISDFSDFYQISRIAFRGNIRLQNILPPTQTGDSYTNWKKNTIALYTQLQADAEAIAQLTPFSYNTEKIQALLNELIGVDQLYNDREKEDGESQQATKDRDEKFYQLRNYCTDLTVVAKIAFKDRPQLLEKMGILVRS